MMGRTPAFAVVACAALAVLVGVAGAAAEPAPSADPTPAATPTATTTATTTANADPGSTETTAPNAAPGGPTSTSTDPNAPVAINYQFLHRLKLDEIQVSGTPETVMRDGLEACQKVEAGLSGPQAAEFIAQKRGMNVDDSNIFVMEAVRYLCPAYLDPLTSQ